MENTDLYTYKPLTNQDMKNIFAKKYEELELLQSKQRRYLRFSRIVRTISLLSVLIVGIIAGIAVWEMEKEWYWIIANILCGNGAAVFVAGCIVLILKPIFYFLRKKAKLVLEQIIDTGDDLQALELFFIEKNTPTEFPEFPPEFYKSIKEKYKLSSIFSDYKELVEAYYDSRNNNRDYIIECACISEWQWVSAAATVVVIAVALIVFYIVFAIIVALTILYLVLIYLNSKDTIYYRTHSNDYHEPYYGEKESLWAKTIGKPFEYEFELLSLFDTEKRMKRRQKKYMKRKARLRDRILKFDNYDIDIQFQKVE